MTERSWWNPNFGPHQSFALGAGTLDITTTAVVLSSPAYVELNPVLAAMSERTLWLPLLYLVALYGFYIAVGAVGGPWLERTMTAYFGVIAFMGVNNLLLFVTDRTLLASSVPDGGSFLFGPGLPVTAIAGGTVWTLLRDRLLPVRRVVLVSLVWILAPVIWHAVW